ncbi:MAG TPA: 30S ribosomal protein S2, partial [Spirochaetia bacterium]|nr:30S ribosomal protein S2 [Spirochaetia bacterium]
FKTIQQSIKRLKKIEEMEETGEMNEHSKKIQSRFFKEKVRLLGIFGGVKEMKTLPSVMIIVDVGSEQIALAEAKKMNIPVVAVVDTDSDPTVVDYAVPGNDDAIRAISLFVRFFSDTISEGVQEFEKSRLINKDKEPETAGDTVAADADPENREKSQTAAATEDISEDMIRHQHEIDEISEKFENEIFPDAEEKIK